MAVVTGAFGALVIIGSALPWAHYSGGDTLPVTLSGITFPSEWGVWTLMLGGAVIFGGFLLMSLVNPLRYFFVAIPATIGVALAAVSCVRPVPLEIGVSIKPDVGVGLAIVLASFALSLATTLVAGVFDWRWRRDAQVLVDSPSFVAASGGDG